MEKDSCEIKVTVTQIKVHTSADVRCNFHGGMAWLFSLAFRNQFIFMASFCSVLFCSFLSFLNFDSHWVTNTSQAPISSPPYSPTALHWDLKWHQQDVLIIFIVNSCSLLHSLSKVWYVRTCNRMLADVHILSHHKWKSTEKVECKRETSSVCACACVCMYLINLVQRSQGDEFKCLSIYVEVVFYVLHISRVSFSFSLFASLESVLERMCVYERTWLLFHVHFYWVLYFNHLFYRDRYTRTHQRHI